MFSRKVFCVSDFGMVVLGEAVPRRLVLCLVLFRKKDLDKFGLAMRQGIL